MNRRNLSLRLAICLDDDFLQMAVRQMQVAQRQQGLDPFLRGLADADEDARGHGHPRPPRRLLPMYAVRVPRRLGLVKAPPPSEQSLTHMARQISATLGGERAGFVIQIGEAKEQMGVGVDVGLAAQGPHLRGQRGGLDGVTGGLDPDMTEPVRREGGAGGPLDHRADQTAVSVLPGDPPLLGRVPEDLRVRDDVVGGPVAAAPGRIMDVPGWKGCADPPRSIKGKCNRHVGGHCNPRTGLWVVVGIAAQKAASDCAGRGGPGR